MSFIRIAGALLLLAAVPASAAGAPAPSDWRAETKAFAAEHFRHPAWGFAHSQRNYALAAKLAAEDKVILDDDVLFAAAMLHDIAAFAPWADPKGDHADQAVAIIPAKLREWGFPEKKIPAVLGAVRTHMYDRKPVGPEAVYLHDADALEWLGAIGIYRLTALVEVGGGQPDGKTVNAMLRQRLEQVPAGVVSPAGKRALPARAAMLRAYLNELAAQSDGYEKL